MKIMGTERAIINRLGFGKPIDDSREYLLASGWKFDEQQRAWISPCDCDWTSEEAIDLQTMRDVVAFLKMRGWIVTNGGSRCYRPGHAPCHASHELPPYDPPCPAWVVVNELRDPVTKRLVKSWRVAMRRELARPARMIVDR